MLKKFEFTDEIIEKFRQNNEIPVHFYNQKGQILIYQKSDTTEKEISALLKFLDQGIYYKEEDSEKLGLKKKREIPEGLSDEVVVDKKMINDLMEDTTEIYDHLKETSISSIHTKKLRSRVDTIFTSFEKNPDSMNGLLDIVEIMHDLPYYEVEIASKRTVVSMAMKTRGMQAQSYKDRSMLQESTSILMMSALLCDIGFLKMNIPRDKGIDLKQLNYIKQHPLMSYLMLSHTALEAKIKKNILCQHRPLRDNAVGNNFPALQWIIDQLTAYITKLKDDPKKAPLVNDMVQQIALLKQEAPYDEDANILALASEFAALTTAVPWREPIHPKEAVKSIVNSSFFSYTERIIREFLDYVAISLCDNEMILHSGDFVVIAIRHANQKPYFEVCCINYIDRYQSRPAVQRVATIIPRIEKIPKLRISGFSLESIRPARTAHYDLSRDSSRNIMYIIDPETDKGIHDKLVSLSGELPTQFAQEEK